MKRLVAPLLLALPVLTLQGTTPAHAQATPAAGATPTTTSQAATNARFFDNFIPDSEIVDRQWYGGEIRFVDGAVPPLLRNTDGVLLTPMIVISPIPNLEIGGMVSWIDYNLDDDIFVNGDEFSGESGLGDLTIWGKYRFFQNETVAVAAGGLIVLPTGSEDDGLGTGNVDGGIFGGVRVEAGPGHILGTLTIRSNQDADILDRPVEGSTSTAFGAGYIWLLERDWALSAELLAESERFEDTDSQFVATGGVQYLGFGHHLLRGAVSFGFTDASPNFDLRFGYAYVF